MKTLNKNSDLGILILRLSLGVLMLLHGIFKVTHGIGFIEQVVTDSGLPHFIAYGVYIGEVIVPIALIVGIATRVSALIYAFNMLVATLLVHANSLFELSAQGGWALELQGLYFFGALALVFTGGGKYAVSNRFIWD